MKRKTCLRLIECVLSQHPDHRLDRRKLRRQVAELAGVDRAQDELATVFEQALARDSASSTPVLKIDGKEVELESKQPARVKPTKQNSSAASVATIDKAGVKAKKRTSTVAAPPPAAPVTTRRAAKQAAESQEVSAAAAALVHASSRGTGRGEEPASARVSGLTSSPSCASKRKRTDDLGDAEPSPASPSKQSRRKPQMPAIDECQQDADGQRMWRQDQRRTEVKHGRFSEEEKITIRQAAEAYAHEHDLSTDDWSWLYRTRTGTDTSKTKGAWQSIAAALPHRKYKAVYSAGTRMLHEGNYQGKWEKEQEEQLLQLVADRGRKWKDIGAVMNRLPESCRDKHKEISLGDAKKKGRWDREETEKLRSIVLAYIAKHVDAEEHAETATLSLGDLSSAAVQEASGRAVLDDIDWGTVSKTLGMRSPLQCMDKWYDQLAPSMTSTGQWASGDDRRMLKSLLRSGPPPQEWMVAWDQLVPGRSSKITQRRWRMMCKCLPSYWNKPFVNAVEHVAGMLAPGLQSKAESA